MKMRNEVQEELDRLEERAQILRDVLAAVAELPVEADDLSLRQISLVLGRTPNYTFKLFIDGSWVVQSGDGKNVCGGRLLL